MANSAQKQTASSENTKPESETDKLIRAALQAAAKRYREQHAEESKAK